MEQPSPPPLLLSLSPSYLFRWHALLPASQSPLSRRPISLPPRMEKPVRVGRRTTAGTGPASLPSLSPLQMSYCRPQLTLCCFPLPSLSARRAQIHPVDVQDRCRLSDPDAYPSCTFF
jgi:hypothetical protein